MASQNILDNDDLVKIDEALAMIDERQEDIIRAKEAGINVEQQERRLLDSRDQLRKIRQAFFPNTGV